MEKLLGAVYTGEDYLFFLFFTLLGMVLIKGIRFRNKRIEMRKLGGDIIPSKRYWIGDNIIDVGITLIFAFLTLRFAGDFLKLTGLPDFVDIMAYGVIIGLGYQYAFHKLLNKVKI